MRVGQVSGLRLRWGRIEVTHFFASAHLQQVDLFSEEQLVIRDVTYAEKTVASNDPVGYQLSALSCLGTGILAEREPFSSKPDRCGSEFAKVRVRQSRQRAGASLAALSSSQSYIYLTQSYGTATLSIPSLPCRSLVVTRCSSFTSSEHCSLTNLVSTRLPAMSGTGLAYMIALPCSL